MRYLHVGIAQVNAIVGAPQENLQRIHRQVQSAAAVGVEVLLFPETVIHAYNFSPANMALAEPLGGALTQQVSEWARQYNMTILAGFLERDGDNIYNSLVVARPDGTMGLERKNNLTETELAAGLTAGKVERTVFEFNGIRCAIMICADCGIKDLHCNLAQQGVEFRFIPTGAGNMMKDKLIPYIHEEELATEEGRALTVEYRGYVCICDAIVPEDPQPYTGYAAANALGDDGAGVRHMGHCSIVDRHRVLRAQIPGTLVIEHQQDQMAHTVLSFP